MREHQEPEGKSTGNRERIADTFLYFAGAVVYLTGAGKLIASGGSARILSQVDRLLGGASKSLFEKCVNAGSYANLRI